MNLLWRDNLPLRTTRMLGDYAVSEVLAHLLGDLTEARFRMPRISPTRYHAADHPAEITRAFIADQETASFEVAVAPDILGHVCTFVDFPGPIPADAQVSACGRGARDSLTGELLTNPGDQMRYLARLAGREDTFQQLREQCAAADIRLAVRVAEIKSYRAWLDDVAMSAGAIWCPGMSMRYPAAVSGHVRQLTGKTTRLRDQPAATVDDTADILRIGYDRSDATGRPQKHIELTASPQRYGGIAMELELPFLRSTAGAVAVGVPILQRLACERYSVPLESSVAAVRPGDWLAIDLAEWPLPGTPTVMAIGVTVDPATRSVEIDAEWMRTPPEVRVTAHTLALADTTDASVEISARNGVVTMTIRDPDGRAVFGARVSLDGGPAQTTNDRGQVSFPYTSTGVPTEHELAIEAPGLEDQTLFILL